MARIPRALSFSYTIFHFVLFFLVTHYPSPSCFFLPSFDLRPRSAAMARKDDSAEFYLRMEDDFDECEDTSTVIP